MDLAKPLMDRVAERMGCTARELGIALRLERTRLGALLDVERRRRLAEIERREGFRVGVHYTSLGFANATSCCKWRHKQ